MAACEDDTLVFLNSTCRSRSDSNMACAADPPVERSPEGIVIVERPSDTDNVIQHMPTCKYMAIIHELNSLTLTDTDRQIIKAINRLQGLHYAHRASCMERWRLDEKSRLDVIWLMCSFEDYLQSKDWPETSKGDEYRTMLDMCKFIFYGPYVQMDIEIMEDGATKEGLMRLYRCICTWYTA
ncbi:hypothetical protein N7523_005194 [Penicillium sp. IBT 18751x]|nr:hypothetical protein N7523_005194 [Penicillium sp. IBT 18751x]